MPEAGEALDLEAENAAFLTLAGMDPGTGLPEDAEADRRMPTIRGEGVADEEAALCKGGLHNGDWEPSSLED